MIYNAVSFEDFITRPVSLAQSQHKFLATIVGFSRSSSIITFHRSLQCPYYYVEINCQLDATDDFYCRSYCLLDMLQAPLCPSSGAREYYTGGCRLWYLVLWFSSCRYGVELRVMCPVCGLLHCSGNQPWTSLQDIYHPDPWHAPVAANTAFSTPDDGRRKRP
jgi:hypothetical protein